MKDEEKTKKSSKKWIIAIVLVVIIATIAFAFFQGFIPTGLMTGTSENSAIGTTGNPTTPENAPIITPTGNEVISKSLVDTSLPYYEALDLEPGKYSIEISSDDPIWIRLYVKSEFDKWQSTGSGGTALVGTRLDENDKVKSLATTFAIYPSAPTKYYLLFLGDKTTIKFKITQTLRLQ